MGDDRWQMVGERKEDEAVFTEEVWRRIKEAKMAANKGLWNCVCVLKKFPPAT